MGVEKDRGKHLVRVQTLGQRDRSERGLPMAALGPWPIRRSGMIKLVTTLGVVAVLGGGTLLAANVVDVSAAATTTLHLSTTAAGASCNNTNPAAPVCSGLASGETVAVSGTGFSPGALASIVQCN